MSMGVNKKSLKASVAGGLLSPPGSLKEDSCAAPNSPPAPRSSKKHMPENDRSKNTHTLPGRKNIYLLSLTHLRGTIFYSLLLISERYKVIPRIWKHSRSFSMHLWSTLWLSSRTGPLTYIFKRKVCCFKIRRIPASSK